MQDSLEVMDRDSFWFRSIVDSASDGILLIDANACVRVFNPACERLFGYTSAEVIGHKVTQLMPGQDYLWQHGSVSSGFGRRKDGSIFPLDLSVGQDNSSHTVAFVGIVRDLTERRRAAQAMRDSERNYRLLVEGVTDYAIYMLDLDGHITSWNSGAQRIKQYTASEVLGKHVSGFHTEEERQRGVPEQHLEIAKQTGRYEANGWRRRKDGSLFWAHVVIEPLRNERGQPIGFAKVTSDITERRRAEQVIREADARINTLIETVVDGVLLFGADGEIQIFNAACQRLFGYRAEEMIGQNVKILMDRADEVELGLLLGQEHQLAGTVREMTGRRKDGSAFPMDLSVGEARQDGEVVYVGVIHDLTDRKRTEQQLVQAQKMETVGQLSGGIAHDFNNLLTVIVGNAEFLGEQLKTRPDLRSLADDIGRAGERGADLTQGLLAFSRRQTLRPVEIDCNELLHSMHKLLQRTMREDIEVRTDFETDLHSLMADRAQLESAIINLALNAQDAMDGGGRLSITTANVSLDDHYQSAHPEVRPGEYVLIAITDDGEGMPKEVLGRVFEPFFTTKEVGKGSGLGLSMVYGFVKQSNGHVSIYSEPGLGTTVRIYLPSLAAKSLQVAAEPVIAPFHPPPTEVVLIVEDDPFVRSYAVMCLRSLGYTVLSAVDGNEALQILGSDARIDILFTDIVMPGGTNGWDLAERAQQMRPEMRVLLTSGYALETMTSRARIREGAVILTKPYRKADLARRLRQMIDPAALH
ncbi:PAS domain S-box-containing protein [Rhodopseudomonas rhenobacensis]|uniref:histidine kinase n=1 Tax=Rhodopseudomonas rhenobacensis TaxID=87461 RepID=A0A7W7Z8C8_9BRAD|nr:PAS domain S-box-containing protein [Rhodopseudomonas rhenobacensis]